ncbi:MAG TPA: hypothetical protein VGL89_10860 [Candidatus Koribacter sp.]|jgi:hypothetical protein
MKRAFLFVFCAAGIVLAQQPAQAPRSEPVRWITEILANTHATVYISDTHNKFVRDSFFYTDIRFTDPCHLMYVEHRNIATADRIQHDMARASLDLRDLAPQQTQVLRYSERHPAQDPLRYTMDGWSVVLSTVSGKPARPVVFDGHLTAERFNSELRAAAEACGAAK